MSGLFLQIHGGQMAQRLETVEKDLVSAEEQLETARKDAKSNRRALEDAQDEVTAASNVIAGHNLRMEERRKKAAAATDTRMALAMETGDLDNQIRLLEKLARDYEGFGRAVRMVMQAKGDLRGIHGPVGNLMKTDARFTVAVEIGPVITTHAYDVRVDLQGLSPALREAGGIRVATVRITGAQPWLNSLNINDISLTCDLGSIAEPGTYTMPLACTVNNSEGQTYTCEIAPTSVVVTVIQR